MDIHVYVHMSDDLGTKESLRRIEAKLAQLVIGVEKMAPELEAVQREVQENSNAVDSAVTLLGTLSQLIKDNATDPEALRRIAADLDTNEQRLAQAVVANTPAAGGGGGEPTPA